MKQVGATEAKNRFGQVLEMALSEPVAIEKKDRRVAVLMSFAEYERLMELEDRFWGEKAQAAMQSGFLSEEETREWLKEKV